MLAQVPKAVADVAPKVIEVIVLDPIIVKTGIQKTTALLLTVLAFGFGYAAASIRNGLNETLR